MKNPIVHHGKTEGLSKLAPRQLNELDRVLGSPLAPTIQTTANPGGELLKLGRSIVQTDGLCRRIFGSDSTKEQLVDAAATAIAMRYEDIDDESLLQVSEYLADEFQQLQKGLYVLHPETGRVVAVIREEDFWHGPPVPRESGNMVQPLPRIRPELEGFITSWFSERDRENRIFKDRLVRLSKSTGIDLDPSDSRLSIATQEGRKSLVAPLAQEAPHSFLRRCGGSTGAFLKCFRIIDSDDSIPTGFTPLTPFVATARSALRIAEAGTFSSGFNRTSHLRGVFGQGWVREIARAIGLQGRDKFQTGSISNNTRVIVSSPDSVNHFRQYNRPVLPVESVGPLAFEEGSGIIKLPEHHELGNAELSDVWYTASAVEVEVFVRLSKIILLDDVVAHEAEVDVSLEKWGC